MGAIPVGDAVSRLPDLGVTHVVNCRAELQTRISNDLWAERQVLGADRVMAAPMWDHGRAQPPAAWAPAAEFGARALEEDPSAGVLAVGGKMVDRPHLVQAQNVLTRAQR